MKILVVQDYLRSGGTERQSVLLARGFAAAGHPTHLITFRPGGPLTPETPQPELHLQSLQKRDTKLDWWAPGLVRRAKALAPDVVLCMGRMANCYGSALQRALPATAVISTLRTGKALPRLFRRSLRQTRHTIANSHAARQRVIDELGLSPDAVSVIHNALVFAPRAPDSAERERVRAQLGATARTVVLLDVAMFRPEKNQVALLDIMAELNTTAPVQLWLAGEGPSLAACQTRAAELGLEDRVRFLGWTADPAPLYTAADLAVHASKRESLSNFLIEAQAHGLPAVAYDALGVSETFEDGVSGHLIPAGNQYAFRAALTALVDDAAARHTMGAQARTHANARFSTERQIAAYLERFDSLLTTPNSSA